MGTRALTKIFDKQDSILVTLYRQMDGYPEGHGLSLTTFLKDMTLVDGFNSNTPKTAANGMQCLAAQIIAHFKTEIGRFYIVRPTISAKNCDAEYVYAVYPNKIIIKEVSWDGHQKTIFKGTWEEAYEYCLRPPN